MKLFLGLTENSAPQETRIFAGVEDRLIDLRLAYAARRQEREGLPEDAYELGAYYFPSSLATFLERGLEARKALDAVLEFVSHTGASRLSGPAGEKIAYPAHEIRLLPPLTNPQKSIVVGYSDRARIEALPEPQIPTGFYKLPQTFVTDGAPIRWPKFAGELDADACLAMVMGKPGRRIPPEDAWRYLAGVTLLIDVTARDIQRREGATSNNLLGKNFPSSTSLGPALLLAASREEVEDLTVDLSIDGASRQRFALKECVFSVEQIIARWSMLGLRPGDVLAIGASMAPVGGRLQEPAGLRVGATIHCASPAIGELTHRVLSSGGAQP